MVSLQDWLTFLKNSQGAAGLPLVVAGLALALFGWRMWRICVILAYGFIGGALGAMLAPAGSNQWYYAVPAGVLLGALSYWPLQHAITLLGGLIGGGAIILSLQEARVTGAMVWAMGACAFAACTAMAALNRQRVVVAVTAFLGAVCLVSGIVCWIMPWPGVYGTLTAMTGETMLVVPFLLIVPTVMSWFYQVSEIHRLRVEI
jgi:hypothetical protein